ncbi:MAG: GNAT family N-acetyltransferase [Bacteroides sp.]|nr:GNAT family N-acetyltransferase [Eubacterium sp.]MCM1418427.1 GNAT family N-acetyltransferase [Roseburia sp.]MCM1461552.1 GNAT family N-acetyltransferase [Bacteroides sp.]
MIGYAEEKDFDVLRKYDKHIDETELKNVIKAKRVLVIFEKDVFIGWLRFNLFWDEIPFMNMLFITEGHRGRGNGKRLLDFWENEMKSRRYKTVMTSTRSDERAQFFYRKNGYIDRGALLLPGEPLEVILTKELI